MPYPWPDERRVHVDAQHRRVLVVAHVAQKNAADHLGVSASTANGIWRCRWVMSSNQRDALIGRHPTRAGADEQLLLVVWPGLPGVDVGTRERPDARAWPAATMFRSAIAICCSPQQRIPNANRRVPHL